MTKIRSRAEAVGLDMHDVVKRLVNEDGDHIRCPFHSDSGKSMRIYDDHAFCPECGIFSPVTFVMARKNMTQAQAVGYLASSRSDGMRKVTDMMRRFYEKHYGRKSEHRGYVPKALNGRIPLLAGYEGKDTIILDDGFWCDGTVHGSPSLECVQGRGDYITLCSGYEEAARLDEEGHDACVADEEKIDRFGRPVIAPDMESAERLSERGVRAGVMENGAPRWIEPREDKGTRTDGMGLRTVPYTDHGDLFNRFRSVYGIDRLRLSLADEWLFMTGRDAVIDIDDMLLTPSPGSAEHGRYLIAVDLSGRRHVKDCAAMEDIAPEKDRHVAEGMHLHRRKENPPFKYAMPGSEYFRFRLSDIIMMNRKIIRIDIGDGHYYEADVNDVCKIARKRPTHLYLPADAKVKEFAVTEDGTVLVGRSIEKDVRLLSIENDRTRVTGMLKMLADGDRPGYKKIILDGKEDGEYIDVQERYITANDSNFYLTITNGHTFPIRRNGQYERDEKGKVKRIDKSDLRKRMILARNKILF